MSHSLHADVSTQVPADGFAELDDAAVAAYRRDGVLRLRGVVRGAELEALRGATERLTAEAVEHGRRLDAEAPIQLRSDSGFDDWEPDESNLLYARDTEGRRVWRRAEAMWARDVAFRTVTANPRLLATVERLGGPGLVPAQDSMVVKMPGAGAAIPWHRDPSGRELIERDGDASSQFVCDVYVDASGPENGCVWAIPGSHRNLDEVQGDRWQFEQPDAVPLLAEPGDLLIHSIGVLHCSPPNPSPAFRRVFYPLFLSAEVLHTGIFQRDDAWIEAQRGFLAAIQEERRALGWE